MNKFSWGDIVVIIENAPLHFLPGEIVSICSMIEVPLEDVGKKPFFVKPGWLYTVEFGNGKSIEVPECYLKHYK